LRAEGRAMLTALLADFAALPGVEPLALPDAAEEESHFRALARGSDFTLVIAPEFQDLLLNRCRWVLEEGGRLLGPAPAAVARTGDNRALAELLNRAGVPHPACFVCQHGLAPGGEVFPAVLKPRHGAGSLATCLVRTAAEMHEQLPGVRTQSP